MRRRDVRARSRGTGALRFGHPSRALVVKEVTSGRWLSVRHWNTGTERFDAWHEAMRYALTEEER